MVYGMVLLDFCLVKVFYGLMRRERYGIPQVSWPLLVLIGA